MTNRNLEQEAQKIGEESLSEMENNAENFGEDQKERMVPISELRKVRYEAAKYRKELQSLRNRVDEDNRNIQMSSMEEIEKLRTQAMKSETELSSLRAKLNQTAKESAIFNAANSLGFCNPKDAVSLVDLNQIAFDENGNIDEEKVFDLIKNLGESKPYLKREQSRSYYGPTNPAPRGGNFPKPRLTTSNQIEQLKQQARDMTRQGRIVEATKLFNRAWESEYGLKKTE